MLLGTALRGHGSRIGRGGLTFVTPEHLGHLLCRLTQHEDLKKTLRGLAQLLRVRPVAASTQ